MATETEEMLYDNLNRALVWLDHLAARYGDLDITDYCPNNWGGRIAIRDALATAEAEDPTIANFPVGTFITDGCIRGYVTARYLTAIGGRGVAAYRVDVGGGREDMIICDQARRA